MQIHTAQDRRKNTPKAVTAPKLAKKNILEVCCFFTPTVLTATGVDPTGGIEPQYLCYNEAVRQRRDYKEKPKEEPQYSWYDKNKQEGGVHKHDTRLDRSQRQTGAQKTQSKQTIPVRYLHILSAWMFKCLAGIYIDTNSRYERNTERIEPQHMCGTENKQVAKCTSTSPEQIKARDRLEHRRQRVTAPSCDRLLEESHVTK